MDAWTGRVGNPVTLQKYLYGNVDPVLMTDPSGQFSIGLALSPISTSSRLSYSVGSSAVRFGSNAFGTAARATFSGGRVVGAVLRKEIRNCTASKGNRCRLPNIVVVGSNISAAQDHISAAQTGRGNYKDGVGRSPTRLTYLPRSKQVGGSRWYRNKAACAGTVSRASYLQCDEYPFYASKQGGSNGWNNHKVSLQPIRQDHNGKAGSLWGAATRGIKNTKTRIMVVPWGPISFYRVTVNGKTRFSIIY